MAPRLPSSVPTTRPHRRPKHQSGRITPTMTCDAAFRTAAQACLQDVITNQDSACDGDVDALHRMRIGLTRLRTLVSFFSPMVSGPEWTRLKRELKWLNGHLGAARDMDVLMMQLEANEPAGLNTLPAAQQRRRTRAVIRQRMVRALRSQRHQRLVRNLSLWIESGNRTAATRKHSAESIATYAASRLSRWQKKVLKKSRHLENMNPDKRHRLRIATKRLRYAMEYFGSLASSRYPGRHKEILKHLRKAQESLGGLNDAERIRVLMASFPNKPRPESDPRPQRIKTSDSTRDTERLLREAAAAYRKMEKLESP